MEGSDSLTSLRMSDRPSSEELSRFKKISLSETNGSDVSRSLIRRPVIVTERVNGLIRTFWLLTLRWRVAESLLVRSDLTRGAKPKKARMARGARTAADQMGGFFGRLFRHPDGADEVIGVTKAVGRNAAVLAIV